MRRLAVAVLAALSGLLINPGVASATECEISWQSDTVYTVLESGPSVEVEAVAWPDLQDWGPGCGEAVLSFPVVPDVRNVTLDAPIGYRLDIQESTSRGLSSSVIAVFAAEGTETLRAGVSVSYTLVIDGDWVTAEGRSVRFPAWSVGDREGSTVTVASGGGDVVVASAPDVFGESSLGSATYTLGRDLGWDAHAAVTFGSYERFVLAEGLVYFVDRDAPDPDIRVIDGAADGLRAIEKLLGPRPSIGKELDLIEVGETSLGGYAGQYNASFEVIQVDASLMQGTLLHEIAHAWLKGDTFADPWMSEGLADYISQLVEAELPDTDATPPIEAEWVTPTGVLLHEWDSEPLVSDAATDRVDYGYAASLWVIDRVAQEVGGPELIRYVASLIAASRISGSPIASGQFLVGLENELGFTDRDGAFEALVFGGSDAITAARAVAPPLVADAAGVRTLPTPGIGLGVLAAVAALVAVFVARSLRSRPLGHPISLTDTEGFPMEDDWEIDEFAEDVLVDSDWSF